MECFETFWLYIDTRIKTNTQFLQLVIYGSYSCEHYLRQESERYRTNRTKIWMYFSLVQIVLLSYSIILALCLAEFRVGLNKIKCKCHVQHPNVKII